MENNKSTKKSFSTLSTKRSSVADVYEYIKSFEFTLFGHTLSVQKRQDYSSRKMPKSIAMIAPSTHPTSIDIQRNFVETLSRKANISLHFDQYFLNPSNPEKQQDRSQLKKDISSVVAKKYDLLFTFGALCTLITKEATEESNILTPILFSGVERPENLGVIKSTNATGNHLTGFSALQQSYAPHVSLLLTAKPHTKNVLIAHNSIESWLCKEIKDITQLLNKHNVNVHTTVVNDPQELEEKIAARIHNMDALFVLCDNVIVPEMKTLVNICNQTGTTLFASDLYSVDEGAALGLGIPENITGIESAEKALLILENNIHPSKISVTPPSHNFKMKANKDTMLKQGLMFPHSSLFSFVSTK